MKWTNAVALLEKHGAVFVGREPWQVKECALNGRHLTFGHCSWSKMITNVTYFPYTSHLGGLSWVLSFGKVHNARKVREFIQVCTSRCADVGMMHVEVGPDASDKSLSPSVRLTRPFGKAVAVRDAVAIAIAEECIDTNPGILLDYLKDHGFIDQAA